MTFPTPLRLATFAATILLRAVLVNHVAAWLQTQDVERTVRAVFAVPTLSSVRSNSGAGPLSCRHLKPPTIPPRAPATPLA